MIFGRVEGIPMIHNMFPAVPECLLLSAWVRKSRGIYHKQLDKAIVFIVLFLGRSIIASLCIENGTFCQMIKETRWLQGQETKGIGHDGSYAGLLNAQNKPL